jgi:transposase
MRGPKAVCIELNDDKRSELEARARRRKTSRGDAMRASIVPLAASGMTNLAIAKRLRTTRVSVATWRIRFATRRMDALSDEPRPGAPRKIGDDKITEVVTAKLETMPATATLRNRCVEAVVKWRQMLNATSHAAMARGVTEPVSLDKQFRPPIARVGRNDPQHQSREAASCMGTKRMSRSDRRSPVNGS